MKLEKSDLDLFRDVIIETVTPIVKNIVQESEENLEKRIDENLEKLEERVVSRINREISDVAENTREMLLKIDNHETRINKLEVKTSNIK